MEVRTGGAPSRCAFSKLGFGFPDSGIPDSIVEVVFLGRRADLFKDRHFGPVKRDLVADPGLRVGLWIREGHRKLQVVRVDSTVALLEAHLVAVRTAKMIEPRSVVITNGLHDERISFPFANRVSPPCRIRILGEFAAIRPDGAPYVMELHVLQHPVLSLNELKGSLPKGRVDNPSGHSSKHRRSRCREVPNEVHSWASWLRTLPFPMES